MYFLSWSLTWGWNSPSPVPLDPLPYPPTPTPLLPTHLPCFLTPTQRYSLMHNTNWPCFADNFQVTKLPPGSPTHLLSSQYFPAVRCIPWLLVRVNWTLVSVSATNRPRHNLPETDCKNWAMPSIKRGSWQLDEEVLSFYRCCHTEGLAIWDKMQRKTEFVKAEVQDTIVWSNVILDIERDITCTEIRKTPLCRSKPWKI